MNTDERIPAELMQQYHRVEGILMGQVQQQQELLEASKHIIQQSGVYINNCARSSQCSRVLEEALQYIYMYDKNMDLIVLTFKQLHSNICDLCVHSNGSHVIQTLLALLSRIAREDADANNSYSQLVTILCKEENMERFFNSNHATQVLKTILRVESGQTPEKQQHSKRNHSFYQLMTKIIYGPSDKYSNKQSNHLNSIKEAIFKQLEIVKFNKACTQQDVSAMMQEYVDADNVSDQQSYIQFILQMLRMREHSEQYIKLLSKMNQTKQLIIFDDSEVENDEYTPGQFVSQIEQKMQEHQFLKYLIENNGAVYLVEKLFEQERLQMFAVAFLLYLLKQNLNIKSIINNNQDHNLLFLYQKCLSNIQYSPQLIVQQLNNIQENSTFLLETDVFHNIFANILTSCQNFEKRGFQKYLITPEQYKQQFNEKLKQFIDNLAELTNNKQYFVRRLLLPSVDDTEQLNLQQFTHNQKYEFKALQQQIDKDKTSDADYQKLMEQKRQEHEKTRFIQDEQKYGRSRNTNFNSDVQFQKVWPLGKDFLVQIFKFKSDQFLHTATISFYDSFLNPTKKLNKQLVADLKQLITNSSTNQLLVTFVENQNIPLFYKLSMVQTLKQSFDEVSDNKLGRLFIIGLIKQIYTQMQPRNDNYDIQQSDLYVNMSSLTMICEELSQFRRLRFLQKSPEGQQIIQQLNLDLFCSNAPKWEQTMFAHFQRISKNYGFPKVEFRSLVQVQPAKTQTSQRQSQNEVTQYRSRDSRNDNYGKNYDNRRNYK